MQVSSFFKVIRCVRVAIESEKKILRLLKNETPDLTLVPQKKHFEIPHDDEISLTKM